MKALIKRIIREAINRSFGGMNDLSKYRDINLDSSSSLSKARSSQGLKASNVSDFSKNVPFDSKMGKLYSMILSYMGKKFGLKGIQLRERGNELREFIKNFLTRDEVEKFYYRLSRFNNTTKEFKRICEQFLDYMQTGKLSDIDVYDKVDMGDEDNRVDMGDEDAYSVSSYQMLQDQLSRMKKRMKPIKEKIYLIKKVLSFYSKYKPLDREDMNFAISNGLIDSNEFSKKISLSKTGGVNRERDVFINMLNNNLSEYNNQLKYLQKVIIDMYNEYNKNIYK
jgi:chaperonin cofactor prefoldin